MGRSKLKKKLKRSKLVEELKSIESDIPIKNLPEKFLWMHVKSGTKIRNVLGYALKEFPKHDSVVWTGIGHGIAKTISCAELFKRKHADVHQITKLCYVKSKESKEVAVDGTNSIPEIHILLTKSIKDTTELGYQAPGDSGQFPEKQNIEKSKTGTAIENVSCGARFNAEQFAAMGLRTGQKRPKETQAETVSKKNKKSRS